MVPYYLGVKNPFPILCELTSLFFALCCRTLLPRVAAVRSTTDARFGIRGGPALSRYVVHEQLYSRLTHRVGAYRDCFVVSFKTPTSGWNVSKAKAARTFRQFSCLHSLVALGKGGDKAAGASSRD